MRLAPRNVTAPTHRRRLGGGLVSDGSRPARGRKRDQAPAGGHREPTGIRGFAAAIARDRDAAAAQAKQRAESHDRYQRGAELFEQARTLHGTLKSVRAALDSAGDESTAEGLRERLRELERDYDSVSAQLVELFRVQLLNVAYGAVRRYFPSGTAFSFRKEVARDTVQFAWKQLWEYSEQIRELRALQQWLGTVIVHEVKRRARRERSSLPVDVDALGEPGSTTEERLAAREVLQEVALKRLKDWAPGEDRPWTDGLLCKQCFDAHEHDTTKPTICALFFHLPMQGKLPKGYSTEVGYEVGQTANAVRQHVYRARRTLGQEISRLQDTGKPRQSARRRRS